MYPEDVDDVDILFARLAPAAPPAELHARVLAAAQERSRRRRLIGCLLLAGSIVLAAVLSFAIGQSLRVSGALTLLGFLSDAELFSEAPAEVALALFELVPWHLVALVAGALALVVVAVRLTITPSIRFSARTVGQ